MEKFMFHGQDHPGLTFNKSLDGGLTWMAQEQILDPFVGGWDYNVTGIYRVNGLPITVCDLSNSVYKGTIYINWTDQRNGTTDTDVWLIKSTDGGNTWSAPIRVNNDAPGKQQFFTWMTVDQKTGYLWFVWYDRRNYSSSTVATDVYMAVSRDGGISFNNFKVSQTGFSPIASAFFGDYTNISAYNNVVRPIWTSMNTSGASSIYTAIIDTSAAFLGLDKNWDERTALVELEQNVPNPFDDHTIIGFKLLRAGAVTLSIYNAEGELIFKPINNEVKSIGRNVIALDKTKIDLQKGFYFYILELDGIVIKRKMIKNQ
jgi:hypothetical protein